MRFQWSGKRALVTGASSGIGLVLARALAAEGVEVALSGRREAALVALAQQIAADGSPAPIVLPADLSKRGAGAELAVRAEAALGQVDILINNAGVGMLGSQCAAGDSDTARDLYETNYWSPLALIQALVPAMRARGAGSVVNVSSMGAVIPFVLTGHYGSSKASLATASDALRMELRGSGVSVLLVLPGPVETAMLAEARQIPGIDGALKFMAPGTTETLAKLIVRGISRGQREIVYPRPLWALRLFPTFGSWVGAVTMRRMDGSDTRVIRGGSAGDAPALEARKSAG